MVVKVWVSDEDLVALLAMLKEKFPQATLQGVYTS